MKREETDILVSGGGIAGLSTAAAFADAGFSVHCVDPRPAEAGTRGADQRSTALLRPAARLLERGGLWERIAPEATALWVLRVAEARPGEESARLIRDFDAAELGDAPFGWNVPNAALRRTLSEALAAHPNAALHEGVATERVTTREGAALVDLTDGRRLAARLLVAADGRDSPVREMLGIGVRTTRYGQKALAFTVTHPRPHGNVSTEIYRSGGPFTLIPLPDRDGHPASAVVWMEEGPEAARLAALGTEAFEAEMSERSCRLFGPLTLASERSLWPIVSQIARRFHAQRAAFVAEAAHTVPPIGAQGLNMSLADAEALVSLAEAAPESLGTAAMLARYERLRRAETEARMAGIDAFNRLARKGGFGAGALRGAGLGSLHFFPAVRGALMRAGLGSER